MFVVGDYVRVIENDDQEEVSGLSGVIVIAGRYNCGVDFGKGFDGHKLEGELPNHTGWYVKNEYLVLSKRGNGSVY